MGGHSPVNSENKVLLQIYVLENVNMTCFFPYFAKHKSYQCYSLLYHLWCLQIIVREKM